MALPIHGSNRFEYFLSFFERTIVISGKSGLISLNLGCIMHRIVYLIAVIAFLESAVAGAQDKVTASGSQNEYLADSPYAPHDSGPDLWSMSAILVMSNENIIAVQSRFLRLPVTSSESQITRVSGTSAWWFTHLFAGVQSITDVAKSTFTSSATVSRDALGLAGSELISGATHVWIHGDELILKSGDQCATSATLRASAKSIHTVLELSGDTCAFVPVTEFRDTSATFIQQYDQVKGQIDGVGVRSGTAWLQRGWGRLLEGVSGVSSLGESAPVVSDQFRLSVPGNQYLSLLQTRRRDGNGTPVLSAMLFSDNTAEPVDYRMLELEEEKWWASNSSGNQYASAWRLRFSESSGAQNDVVIRAVVSDQELHTAGQGRWTGLVSAEWQIDADSFATYGFVDLAPSASGESR